MRMVISAVVLFLTLFMVLTPPVAVAADPKAGSADVTVWKGYLMPGQSDLAQQIYMALWDTEPGVKEGLALFEKSGKTCIGRLSLHTGKASKTPQHPFELVEGDDCSEFQGGSFKYHARPRKNLKVTWFPAGYKAASLEALITYRQANDVIFAPAETVPERLQAQIAGYKTNKALAEMKSPEELAFYSESYEAIKSSLAQPVFEDVSDTELIGVWKGKFIDAQEAIPAEMAIWPAKNDRGYQKMYGIVLFEGNLCTVGAEISRENGVLSIGLSHAYLSLPYTEEGCILMEGMAPLKLHQSGRELGVYLDAERYKDTKVQEKQCLQGWPLDGCYVAGAFTRAKASSRLEETMAQARWMYSSPPDAETWALMKDNRPVTDDIKRAHTAGVAQNEAVTRQHRLEDERDRQQRLAKLRAEAAADKQREIRAREVERRSRERAQGSYAGGDPGRLKVVNGPFDGLSASSYLNAIYQADWATVAQYDQAYGYRKVQQFRKSLGNKPHIMSPLIESAYQSMKLTDTVLAIYLFAYDSKYRSCLRKDAVEFEVVEHVPDTVFTNLLGQEVARSYGYTSRERFKVNKEFTQAFRRVGRTKPVNAASMITDFFLNQGGTDTRNELIKGTSQLMNKFSCDCDEIKQLEQNLVRAPH